jgi:hypothetical protein
LSRRLEQRTIDLNKHKHETTLMVKGFGKGQRETLEIPAARIAASKQLTTRSSGTKIAVSMP